MGETEVLEKIHSEQKGLTWRSMMAFVFIVFIIQPAIVYNWLVEGLWGLALTSWAVILLWVGLTRLLGSPLTSKEIFIIRTMETTGLMATGYFFAYLLRNQYFANSEVAQIFGLQHAVPRFFSPLGDDAIRSMMNRTFFDAAWALPILVGVFIPISLSAIANYTLGLFAFSLYAREEKLEFPFATWDAKTMKSFGDRDLSRIRVIALAILAGAVYGFATYGLTTLISVPLVPRTLVEFTSIVETVLPGASFSFSTDLTLYLPGFIIDIKYTAAQFIASVALYVFGNTYITENSLWPVESQWIPNQRVFWHYSRSMLYFWNSFTIGWGIAVAVIPLLLKHKTVIRAFASIRERTGGFGGKWLNSKLLLLVYLSTAATAIILTLLLVPGFPVWVLVVFTLGVSFVITLLQTHAAGISGGFSLPYLRETLIYTSGYSGLDIWFLPSEMSLFLGGSGISQQLIQASMLGVDVKEYTKTFFLIIALGLAGSFTFVSLFWRLNPIPGWAYPYTISAWPVEAMNFWRWQSWLWTGYLFRPTWMYTGFGISTALYLVCDLVLHIPSFPIAMMTGMLMPPWAALAQFAGSLLSIAAGKFIGGGFWEANKGFVVIGMLIGDGLVSTILSVWRLISRSTWLMPY